VLIPLLFSPSGWHSDNMEYNNDRILYNIMESNTLLEVNEIQNTNKNTDHS
jgi:hypothetical protein